MFSNVGIMVRNLLSGRWSALLDKAAKKERNPEIIAKAKAIYLEIGESPIHLPHPVLDLKNPKMGSEGSVH